MVTVPIQTIEEKHCFLSVFLKKFVSVDTEHFKLKYHPEKI